MAEREPQLRQVLLTWQIFMIAISTVIGVTIFYGDGEALEVAGPSGALLAFVIVGIVAICVMEGISEMIQMFPTPNALMEFVRAFVDEDLAWVVGVAYWYTYSVNFATHLIIAAGLTDFWALAQVYQTIVFYVLTPAAILSINFAGVFYFGWIETVGGILKICIVVGGAMFMYVIHEQEHYGSEYINDGFRHNNSFAKNSQEAVCYVVPLVAYAFIGVEMISMTAFEARDLRSLRIPSKIIAYFVVIIYLMLAIGEFLNVKWVGTPLPEIDGINGTSIETSRSNAVFVIAAAAAGYKRVPGLLNGFMIYSALSASNSYLYVASRALYGMTRTISPWGCASFLKELGSVWHKTGVPMWALFISFLAFLWLPFLQLSRGYAIADLRDIISTSSSVSCLLVWASQCLAFIRYHAWLRKHRDSIAQVYPEHNRWRNFSQASSILGGLQPVIAWLGLIGCLVIVFVFTTATWWSTPVDFSKVAVAYGAPIVLTGFFLVLKLITWRRPIHLDNDFAVLAATIEHLKFIKPERQHGSQPDGDTNQPRRLKGFLAVKRRSQGGGSSSTGTEVGLQAILTEDGLQLG